MGFRLGIPTIGYTPLEAFDMMEQNLIIETNAYPGHPLISQNDWAKITSYIVNHAPDSFQVQKDQNEPLKEFDVETKGSLAQIPAVTLLTYDSITKLFHIGLEPGNLFTYDQRWNRKDSINLHATPIDFVFTGGRNYLLSIGKMYPSEYKIGSLFEIKSGVPEKLISALHRPVSMTFTDMNGDQINDVIISEFGFETGSLSWFQSQDMGIDTNKHILKGVPGAVKTMVVDMDNDGINDLVVLMAQGDEHISVYKMNEKGIDKELKVLRFPPVHGICDIDINDFNYDGKPDLIVSNGDNADYSQIIKPYHGITVYLNKGNLNFDSTLFIPYPGVLQCKGVDIDQDGDMDFVATSYFPGDKENNYAPFKYFEQKDEKFIAKTFKGSRHGKWMRMITGDFDSDGDQDILLGSFLLNTFLVEGDRDDLISHSLVLLKNNLVKNIPGNSKARK